MGKITIETKSVFVPFCKYIYFWCKVGHTGIYWKWLAFGASLHYMTLTTSMYCTMMIYPNKVGFSLLMNYSCWIESQPITKLKTISWLSKKMIHFFRLYLPVNTSSTGTQRYPFQYFTHHNSCWLLPGTVCDVDVTVTVLAYCSI